MGAVHIDYQRNFPGSLVRGNNAGFAMDLTDVTGPFALGRKFTNLYITATSGANSYELLFDPARMVPVGNANKPRAWGALPCVYLGTPR